MKKCKMPFLVFSLLLFVRLGAGTTPVPNIIQLNGFSVTYNIDDPYSWHVSVSADNNSVFYKYAEAGREGMAEFTVSRALVGARLRMEDAATVANEIIKHDVENILRKAYEDKIILNRDADEKMESSLGSVTLYKSNPFFLKQSRYFFKRHGNFHAYAALILPDDYATRGIAYILTCVELNSSQMERPLQLDKFRAFLSGLNEDAGANDAVAPPADIMREPVFTGKYYKINEVDAPPKPRGRRQGAVYPREMRDKGITGSAVIAYIVDEKGFTQQVQAGFATRREFGESAAKAVEKWRFYPAEKNGSAVSCVMFTPIEFTIGNNVVAR